MQPDYIICSANMRIKFRFATFLALLFFDIRVFYRIFTIRVSHPEHTRNTKSFINNSFLQNGKLWQRDGRKCLLPVPCTRAQKSMPYQFYTASSYAAPCGAWERGIQTMVYESHWSVFLSHKNESFTPSQRVIHLLLRHFYRLL